MRKSQWLLLGVAVLNMLFLAGQGFAGEIRLTEDVVRRYLATFPEFWKLTQETEAAAKLGNEDEKKDRLAAIAGRKAALMRKNRWADMFECMDAGARILRVNIFLNVRMKFAALKDERNPAAMAELKKWQDENGYGPEEIDAVLKYNPELNKMYVQAGLRKP